MGEPPTKGELDELAERWRQEMAQLARDAGEQEAAEAFEQCAYELERVIDNGE